MRFCSYLKDKKILRYLLYPFSKIIYLHYSYKYGISIPFTCSIGKGFYIGHFGGIVVHNKAVIGSNCNISQGVTIGVLLGVNGKDARKLEIMCIWALAQRFLEQLRSGIMLL